MNTIVEISFSKTGLGIEVGKSCAEIQLLSDPKTSKITSGK
jgi:hypothetical protein